MTRAPWISWKQTYALIWICTDVTTVCNILDFIHQDFHFLCFKHFTYYRFVFMINEKAVYKCWSNLYCCLPTILNINRRNAFTRLVLALFNSTFGWENAVYGSIYLFAKESFGKIEDWAAAKGSYWVFTYSMTECAT